ncbi:class I SAM-dependent methyltransferase [Pseudomonas guariconensis]|uniref:class I SAM-dependent methyltransferase n=1 Tax=Pseudomonas TaxID=286 RepID=UPI002097A1DB|nr:MULTISPECIES: class I SAM-dependent methyltransferase [Pseudomonas]MCO7567718.1 class I SAM-dependent methyltransferase [Pseudomonas mosselii]MCO7619109.1 class I SAM-dependent methyltransferase [Pseudomonas guariconensis]
MQNRYGKLASWIYHLDKPIGHSFGDLEYYRQRLAGCDGPILEPAVGNGRILIPMLEMGLVIEGFDASQDMLDYCRQECLSRGLLPTLTCQTFEQFSYDRRFAAIIMPAGSFQLITQTASAMAVLTRFRDHLLPGGRLILDIDPIESIVAQASPVRSWAVGGGDLLTMTCHRAEIDYVKQTTLSHLHYQHWRDSTLLSAELDLFHLRWWGVDELAFALREAGFVDVVVSGDYQHGRQPRKGDRIISFEASRPDG